MTKFFVLLACFFLSNAVNAQANCQCKIECKEIGTNLGTAITAATRLNWVDGWSEYRTFNYSCEVVDSNRDVHYEKTVVLSEIVGSWMFKPSDMERLNAERKAKKMAKIQHSLDRALTQCESEVN